MPAGSRRELAATAIIAAALVTGVAVAVGMGFCVLSEVLTDAACHH